MPAPSGLQNWTATAEDSIGLEGNRGVWLPDCALRAVTSPQWPNARGTRPPGSTETVFHLALIPDFVQKDHASPLSREIDLGNENRLFDHELQGKAVGGPQGPESAMAVLAPLRVFIVPRLG